MISHAEAADLLDFAASYDGRKPNPKAVQSWVDASARGRWGFDDAVDAVRQHYATTTVWLMPGHITEAMRQRRAQPPPITEQRTAIAGSPPADPATITSAIAEVARELGWDEQIDRRAVQNAGCEWCRARRGEQCTRPTRRRGEDARVPCQPHPVRRAAAEDALMDQEANR